LSLYQIPHAYTVGIVLGMICGIVTRLLLLRTDYRQYPTYPHGSVIHLSLGVIAAALGSVAVPAFFSKDFTAITFLTLAAQQFRDVRKMERETLTRIDEQELVPRGAAYIEGIAMVFEGRNYLVILSAFATCMFAVAVSWQAGIAAGIASVLVARRLRSGRQLAHIVNIEAAEVGLEGPDLYVGDIYIMNIGLESSRKAIRERGMGLVLTPVNPNARATIANLGQRQAILYDLSTLLGVYRDTGEPALVPLAKLDMGSGRLGVFFLPLERDAARAAAVAARVPILETAVRMPTEAPGRSGERSRS